MKIGIVTFYYGSNYGAILQAFALKTYLEQKGHSVFFINSVYTRRNKFTFFLLLCSHSLRVVRNKIQHNHAIDTFRPVLDGLRDTKMRYTNAGMLKENYPVADAYVVGSDQMWNPMWCMEHADLLFLNFGDKQTKRVAYAVSLGCTRWPEKTRQHVGELLSQFDAISVREERACNLVAEMSGKSVSWLADPTLLIDISLFPREHEVCAQMESNKAYVFEYFLGETNQNFHRYSCFVKQELQADKVVTDADLSSSLLCRLLALRFKIPIDAWIARISGARVVVTNSFHATIFSIINHRPFLAVLRNADHAGMNERIIVLLRRLGLEKYIIARYDESNIRKALSAHAQIDWKRVDDAIKAWRCETDAFFSNVFRSG